MLYHVVLTFPGEEYEQVVTDVKAASPSVALQRCLEDIDDEDPEIGIDMINGDLVVDAEVSRHGSDKVMKFRVTAEARTVFSVERA